MAEADEKEDLLASFSNLRSLVGKDLLDEAQEIARLPPKATTGGAFVLDRKRCVRSLAEWPHLLHLEASSP